MAPAIAGRIGGAVNKTTLLPEEIAGPLQVKAEQLATQARHIGVAAAAEIVAANLQTEQM